VFGTCVDWHSTVTRALSTAATRSLETRTDLDVGVREKANQLVCLLSPTCGVRITDVSPMFYSVKMAGATLRMRGGQHTRLSPASLP
jgi:hypothetical protein